MYFRGVLGQNHIGIYSLFSPVTGHYIYSAIMSRNRYQFLMRCMSFDDATTRPEGWQEDCFASFHEVFEISNRQCAASNVPNIYLSLAETLYATRQHINFKTYNKSKPARYGLLY